MSQVSIVESSFGRLPDKQEVKKYTLTNKNGFSVSVISYGASIQAINVKDKDGNLKNVALGFNTLEEYANPDLNPYFGSTVGRVTNRIGNAEFKLDGVTYSLPKNNGNNCLHGGPKGLARKNWISAIVDNYVKFSLVSADGDCGFPGELWVEALYKLDYDENKLTIEYKAITDKPTPVNLTNHVYFNLNGHDSGAKIYNHLVQFNSDKYLDFNPSDNLVTGKINQVEGSKYDFRNLTLLSERIKSEGAWPEEGYDNFFIVNGESSELKQIASVKNPSNGLKLNVESNQAGVFFYTGNFLDLEKLSNGVTYKIHDGFCLEVHNYPDSVNHESFPSCILGVEEEYYNKTTYSFSIDN